MNRTNRSRRHDIVEQHYCSYCWFSATESHAKLVAIQPKHRWFSRPTNTNINDCPSIVRTTERICISFFTGFISREENAGELSLSQSIMQSFCHIHTSYAQRRPESIVWELRDCFQTVVPRYLSPTKKWKMFSIKEPGRYDAESNFFFFFYTRQRPIPRRIRKKNVHAFIQPKIPNSIVSPNRQISIHHSRKHVFYSCHRQRGVWQSTFFDQRGF